ncbi:hypothetical protein PVAND_007340 [Polypedilum vanderplanki]|uniref:Transmembrane 9 superfamily member n=1 Tax=Polypedilum vanderplanki TaxID=319348 RepID=A0A9J6C6X0_POLVA|nr:hypothetical protein PVAND_007340 [Polypedilum vanderplanki]
MTISYSAEVPNGSAFGCFWKILWKWRGSVYKLVWRELLAYLGLYYTINFVYRYALNDDQKRVFEKVRTYFGAQSESIPMSFVLGFYVSLVVKRWWEQYKLLPWPDTLALFISAAIPGNQQELGRLMRRNIMRYMVLAYVITLQRISLRVKRRFPGLQHLVDSGLMLESEKKIFEIMDSKSPMSKYWMPLVWSTNIINRARKDGLITSDHIVQTILMELSDIRRRLGALIGYDTVSVPLVYTQVVTLVLYTYFIAALMGRQMVPSGTPSSGAKYEDPDLYFPLFTALQFCFYVGWLKVAEVLINPFGEDDDDIELNWLIDRHIKASYMIVDEMHEIHPELLKDQYWEEVVPKELPYTVASEHYRRHEPKGSAELYKVKEADAVYANIMPSKRSIQDDQLYADYESVDTPMVERRKNWFSRQMQRMGSMRSSSTAYSSGGIFNRNRLNSVYSSPEAGLGPQSATQPSSIFNKFNRKSGKQRQLFKQNSKGSVLNGQMGQRIRERVPTPENENRLNINSTTNNPFTTIPTIASQVTLTATSQQLTTAPSIFQSTNNSVPILGTLLLSPIKESDSVNNTLSSGSLTTVTQSQSILPINITSANAQFGSLVLSGSSNQDIETTNSFVVLPTNTQQKENDMIPVHTLPLAISTTTTTSPIITELPVDQSDASSTPRLENLFSDTMSNSPIITTKNRIQRQQSVDSNKSYATNVDNASNSTNSTLSRRPQANANGKKNNEVYYDEDHEEVVLWMNTVGSKQSISHYHETLSEALEGVELEFSGYSIDFKDPVPAGTVTCMVELTEKKYKAFVYAVKNHYWFQMYIDGLPIWGAVGKEREKKYYIYTHKRFDIGYNGKQIIDVNLTNEHEQLLHVGAKISFTYEINWQPTNTPFKDRFDKYLDPNFFQHRIHWFSIFNSFMMVIFLVGLVSMILVRTLRKDYARYSKDEEMDDMERDLGDEYGWKNIHGDVFRSSSYPILLQSLIGCGYQLVSVVLCVTSFAIMGELYTERGSLLSTAIFVYAATSPINGLFGGALYARMGGKVWIRTMLLSAFLLPIFVCGTAFFINFIAIYYHASRAIPFYIMLAVTSICIFVILPLTLVGTIVGRNLNGQPDHPCRVNAVPRPIPEKKWYMEPAVITMLGGILPFGSIFIEMYFIFTSFWAYKIYYVYGFNAARFSYFDSEDYRWQWTAFLSGASTSIYVYIYAFYYFFFKTKMYGLFQTVFYFGYMALFSGILGIICGTVGYVGTTFFVRKIYSNVKID